NTKIIKSLGSSAFSNNDIGCDATFTPVKSMMLSVQKRWQNQTRNQIRFFPDAVFMESGDTHDTTILRFALSVNSVTKLTGQYENEISKKQSLATTANPTYSIEDGQADKIKLELSSQLAGVGVGGGYESVRETRQTTTANLKTQDTVSAYAQWRWFERLSIKTAFNYIQNWDVTRFESIKPELEADWRTDFLSLTVRYSYLIENRFDIHPITEIWDISAKIDVQRNLAFTSSILQQNRRNPDINTLEISGRLAVTF
ncbi:hypothetical protein EBR96_10615, partial [bacterium]|nr:hypothetical protein [bacterium]